VDWNSNTLATSSYSISVTFCEEGVDWNNARDWSKQGRDGHLLWGRCGLKYHTGPDFYLHMSSPSVRKVWIEMHLLIMPLHVSSSPSVRKVWIEMSPCWLLVLLVYRHLLWGRCGLKWLVFAQESRPHKVTFCEEGVDWNVTGKQRKRHGFRHLLWGRCGLKWGRAFRISFGWLSPSVRKVWIEISILVRLPHSSFCHLLWGRCGLKY